MGIFAGGKAARASGGTVTTVGLFTVHKFTGSTTFTPAATGFVDILLVGAGGGCGGFSGGYGNGGGAGATLFKKWISVTASTPYPVVVGTGSPWAISSTPPGGLTSFTYSGITTTAYGGAGSGDGTSVGVSSFLASGAGGGYPNLSGGTGAGVYGIGYPGFKGHPNNGLGGAGGGAGSGGPSAVHSMTGGDGVPIAYFTGTPTDIVSYGGCGRDFPAGVPGLACFSSTAQYGNGGNGGAPFFTGPFGPGAPGVAYIRYM
jgi:hypothetical protein